jgi:hypothetical protein
MSDGWKENPPKENQLCAPLAVCPATNKSSSKPEKKQNIVTKTSVRFKKRKSIYENIKNTTNETAIQIS